MPAEYSSSISYLELNGKNKINNSHQIKDSKDSSEQLPDQTSSSSSSKGKVKKSQRKESTKSKKKKNSITGLPPTVEPCPVDGSIKSSSSVCSNMKDSSSSSVSSSSSIPSTDMVTSKVHRKYSRSHQRRFHRRFPAVDPHEKLIDWYSCALIADILLQGYLYISETYFAFYSNIFGYKTQLLIPICDVVSVTKEKTAKIFPNAVGICTEETKYVFGSLLSREATFRLLQEVWKSALMQVSALPYFSPQVDDKCSDGTLNMDQIKPYVNGEQTENKEIKLTGSKDAPFNIPVIADFIGATLLPGHKNESDPPLFYNEIFDENIEVREQSDSSCEFNDDQSSDEPVTVQEITKPKEPKKAISVFKKPGLPSTVNRCLNYLQTIKLQYKSASMSSRLLILSIVFLVFLFISVIVLIHRVSQVHQRIATAETLLPELRNYNQIETIHPTDPMDAVAEEVKRITRSLKVKINEVSMLKESLEELLIHIERLPDHCTH